MPPKIKLYLYSRNFKIMNKRAYLFPILFVAVLVVATGFIPKKDSDFSAFSTKGMDLNFHVPNEVEVLLLPEVVAPKYRLNLGKSYLGFKEALGFKESRGYYDVVNNYGYLGKYQFSRSTLQMMGFRNTDNFLYDSRLQEEAFLAYISLNKWILRRDIKNYVGKTIGGVEVTESGILAAAHLAGPGNVKKFLRSSGDYRFEDANGTSVRYYMKKFSDYDTSHIVASKKRRAS